MAPNAPDPTPPKAGGLWARLFGMNAKKPEAKSDATPDVAPSAPADNGAAAVAAAPSPAPELSPPPTAEPVLEAVPESLAPAPAAPLPFEGCGDVAEAAHEPEPISATEESAAVAEAQPPFVAEVPPLAEAAPAPEAVPVVEAVVAPVAAPASAPAAPQFCPVCQSPRKGSQTYCDDCGCVFPSQPRAAGGSVATMSTPTPAAPPARLQDRYELVEQIAERGNVTRFRAIDHGAGGRAVVIVRGALPEMAEVLLLEDEVPVAAAVEEDEFIPTFDTPAAAPVAEIQPVSASWPSVGWELALLEKAHHPTLPAVLDTFADGTYEYLVEDCPEGASLWDAWSDPDLDASERYGWLKQVAEGMDALHGAGAILEGFRPNLVKVIGPRQAMICDLSDLLPLPVPPGTPLRGSLYTAPELIQNPEHADARADLYSFGAAIYCLEYTGHDLEEKDFEAPYTPKKITDRFPDVNPTFFRLLLKTFNRDLNARFPTDEAGRTDPTGFAELIRTLDAVGRSFDNARLDIAAWATTGMVRTGNEDAFGLLQAVEWRQDDLWEYAVILLCDGMGGYEAGEVAAAMCVSSLRTYLLQQSMFAALAGKEPPEPGVFNVEACRKTLKEALRYANKEVHTAARKPGRGRRGMGCTAEAVYVDGRNIVVGHVGDSRTYHLSSGRLVQLTRDQTLVNRLVELGQLTEEEAEDHPRKNELQQAIGGQPDVEPGLYSARLKRGDWILVCSDGLTNHVPTKDLEKMLLRETAGSAEEAARRLLNLVNLRGATDNATIVVIRAT